MRANGFFDPRLFVLLGAALCDIDRDVVAVGLGALNVDSPAAGGMLKFSVFS